MSHQNLIPCLLFCGILLVIATNMPVSPGIQQPVETITQTTASAQRTESSVSGKLSHAEWESGPYPAQPTFDAVMP